MTIGGEAPGAGARAGVVADLAELLRRVAARDEAAFAALYRQTSAKLYGVVARILSRGDAGAEALQETYVRIWENAGEFDSAKGSPMAWMATIARNRALDEVRRVRPASFQDLPGSFEPATDEIDPLASRQRSEALSALLKCLEALDDEKRTVLMLAYYRGLSREALAKRFGRPVATIKTWLHRSLAQLIYERLPGVMTLAPDDDFAAAEYALGTLAPDERAALAARRLREPELDAAIRAWEARLSPLAEAATAVEPPGDYLATIEARIRGGAPAVSAAALDLDLRRRLSRWRAAAVAATSLAAALAIGFAFRETARESVPHQYVAILQKDPASPAFAITVDLDSRELTARPVAAPATSDRSYELWLIDAQIGEPRSLGVISAEGVSRGAKLSGFDRSIVENATYAVTVEPLGGSPSGKPSGPPVFVGKLIPVGP